MDGINIGYSRGTWASLYTLLVVWAVAWVARGFFVNANTAGQQDGGGTTINDGSPQARLDRFIRVMRDVALALLLTLVLNSVLGGIFVRAVLILAWILTAVTLISALGEAVVEKPHFIGRGIGRTIIAAIAIVIGALAFAHSTY